ncbi:MAG TPA: LysR family transcriptional regulator, partial [Firmicutes bacterium]|nr:LysR family transcriptional regulator [Bacillota bacterium]
MNLNFLRTFICVVEEGNYSRAANRLHLSQPAVSMQMQTLAEDLGVELFRRRGHRVELTEGGAI